MREQIGIVQQMIDWIEEHVEQNNILACVSQEVCYSPWYCSTLFHDITGMTLKSYAAGRRLARVTEEIRDTDARILDLAIKYGFSSQEALTRAFKERFGCTPAAYRRNPVALPFQISKRVLFPEDEKERTMTMEKTKLGVRIEYIPEHKYLGVWEEKAAHYGEFWNYHDCDMVCGYITSMDKLAHPVVTPHTAGWQRKNGRRIYFYGTGVEPEYDGIIPDGFELREIPASYYLVFSYPAFDYMTENADVMTAVEELAWNYNPTGLGYEWNEEACPIYQRHYPEKLGYQVLRPVKKLKK